jgi:hypothetical protein
MDSCHEEGTQFVFLILVTLAGSYYAYSGDRHVIELVQDLLDHQFCN